MSGPNDGGHIGNRKCLWKPLRITSEKEDAAPSFWSSSFLNGDSISRPPTIMSRKNGRWVTDYLEYVISASSSLVYDVFPGGSVKPTPVLVFLTFTREN